MRNFKRNLLAATIAVVVSAPAAAQFSGVYFFGDSLTDMGSFKPVLPPGTGLFTTNPGPVWAQPFAQYFGFSATPANQGGNDYAEGGARVTLLPGVPATPPTGTATPVATQISQFLGKGAPNANAIYAVWAGANDFFTQVGGLQAGTITTTQAQANLALAATQLAQQIVSLRTAGAQYIFVGNIPDPAKTPAFLGNPLASSLTSLAGVFNSTLYSTLDTTGVPTIRVNASALLSEVVANPGKYGFVNATAPACGATASLVCTSANFATPQAAQTYVFADGVHPTTGAHAIIAQVAESMITGPQQVAALQEAPFAVEDANFRALDSRMWSALGTPRSQKKLDAWAAYDYGSSDMSAGGGNGSANTNTVAVGLDGKVNDKLLVGGMFGYTENKGDFGGAGGGYKLRQPTGTVYVGYGEGPWYVGATMGAGNLDYTDVNRNIPLGLTVRNESGTTTGWEYTGRLLGGYWFHVQDVLHGPYARLTYTKAEVRAYSESGSDSTALSYGAQSREQLVWSLGWQVAGNIGNVRPFARVTWEYDSMDQTPSVTASSVSLGGSYTVPGVKPDNSYALFNVGASTDFGGVTGFIMGSGTAARGDGNYWGITVGLRMPL